MPPLPFVGRGTTVVAVVIVLVTRDSPLSCLVHTADTNKTVLQDKTVLSCLVLSAVWTELEATQDCLQNCSVDNILRTTEKCRWLSPTQFTLPTPTRQDTLILSVSAVWTTYRHYREGYNIKTCLRQETAALANCKSFASTATSSNAETSCCWHSTDDIARKNWRRICTLQHAVYQRVTFWQR